MIRKIFGLVVLGLYILVMAVAITSGPLVSYQSILLGLLGLIVITIGISSLAESIGLVDIPDNFRKAHIGNVPLIGGIVIFISMIYGTFVFGVEPFYRIIIISLIPILIIGTIDGIGAIEVPVSFRLVAQILASWIVILFYRCLFERFRKFIWSRYSSFKSVWHTIHHFCSCWYV